MEKRLDPRSNRYGIRMAVLFPPLPPSKSPRLLHSTPPPLLHSPTPPLHPSTLLHSRLPRRPREPAPRQHVQVNVKDRLLRARAAVEHRPIIRVPQLFHDLLRDQKHA